ncbi:histidine kinase [Salibacterium halotolerans]|uniref:histidine kinase n=1 Tax=Salibacterium halotolerans TaxID=1884432 RepID=A0A1I5W8K3_9BACI|nr:histidine kinase [Salibacterium halotolerans]SFQ16118.1 Sensor histidine kinase YesM [Salibacterium halotolerans]
MRKECSSLTYKTLAAFFIPLGISSSLTSLTHIIINGTLSRADNAAFMVACYAVAFSMFGIVEKPMIVFRQTSSALVRDKKMFRPLFIVFLYVTAVMMTISMIISFTPLGTWMFIQLFNADENMVHTISLTFFVITFVIIFSGIRGIYQGVIIRHLQTKWLTIGVIVRVAAMFLMAWWFTASGSITSMAGAVIFLTGMCIECAFSVWKGHVILKKTPESGWSLYKKEIMPFYLPMVVYFLFQTMLQPLVYIFLAQSRDMELSIASFALAFTISQFLLSFFMYTHQIVLQFYQRDHSKVWTFTIVLSVIPVLLLLAVTLTPAGGWFMNVVMGAEPGLAGPTLIVLQFFIVKVLVFPWVDFFNGFIMLERRTPRMMVSQTVNIVVVCLVLLFLVNAFPEWNGANGAIAASIGEMAGLITVICLVYTQKSSSRTMSGSMSSDGRGSIRIGTGRRHRFHRLKTWLKLFHPTTIFNQFTKIRNKLFSLTFLLMAVFGVIGLSIFYLLSEIYENKIYEEAASNLHLASNVLDNELKNMEDYTFQIVTNPTIQLHMEQLNADNNDYNAYRIRMELINRLNLYLNQESYISSMLVVDGNGNIINAGFSPDINLNMEELISRIEEEGGGNVWKGFPEEEVLVSAREIRKKENLSLDHLGYMITMIDLEAMINRTLNITSDKSFVITNESGILHSDTFESDTIDTFLGISGTRNYAVTDVGNEEFFVTHEPSRYYDLTYYNTLPFEDVDSQKSLIYQLMAGYTVLVAAITLFISRQSAKAISRPIEELTRRMKKVQQGNFDQVENREPAYLRDEIGDLQRNFHIMLNKINDLIKENYTKQLVIKETEYKALQSQINPHFLYNTLDSIHWMAKMRQKTQISQMAEALGNMMRNIISKKKPMIQVSEELEIVENYITIQKFRYGERLQFSLDQEPGTGELSIPKLTIQPIVENAIQHALEEMMDPCSIRVAIARKQEALAVMVRDSGPGIDEKKIRQIHDGVVKPKGSGIGLYNINERIHLMFGEDGGVTIENAEEGGTVVTITLPYIRGEQDV